MGKTQIGTDEAWFQFGAGPGFVTVVSHVPAKQITVAALSSGDADLRLLTTSLTETTVVVLGEPVDLGGERVDLAVEV